MPLDLALQQDQAALPLLRNEHESIWRYLGQSFS